MYQDGGLTKVELLIKVKYCMKMIFVKHFNACGYQSVNIYYFLKSVAAT